MQPDQLTSRVREVLRARSMQILMQRALVLLSLFFLALFLYSAARRIHYPFELEWIESGMLVSVLRIVHGQQLYVAPSLSFVPFLYAPLFFYVAAAATKITGATYAALRLVSIVSSLASVALIYRFVFMETRRHFAAAAGAGLFLACYPLVETFYDIGRVDSLFVFLFLLAVYLLRRNHPVASALVWVLCFQTKQSILPVAAVLLLCGSGRNIRRIALGFGTYLAALGLSMYAMNRWTDGWYNYYLFHIMGGFGINWREVVLFFPNNVLACVGIAILLTLAAWVLTQVDLSRRIPFFYAIVTFIIFGAIAFVAAHKGASGNAYMPAYAWTAILFGVALGRLFNHLERAQDPNAQMLNGLVLVAAIVQLTMLIYNPGGYVPNATVLAARNRFIDQIRSIPGDVYVIDHTYDAELAGKKPHAEFEALGAVIDSTANPESAKMLQALQDAVRQRQFSAIVLDGSLTPEKYHLDNTYSYAISAEHEDGRFLTSQPTWILFPCASAPALAPPAMYADTVVSRNDCATR